MMGEKIGQNFFSLEKLPSFSKTCVFNILLGVTEVIFQLPQQTTDYLVDPYNCPMRCDTLDIVKKCRPKSFIYWKFGLFFKNFCFQQPLRCYRNGLVTSAVKVKIPGGPLQIVPWGLSHSIMRKRLGEIHFFAGRLPYFSENCVYNNLLGPKEMIL